MSEIKIIKKMSANLEDLSEFTKEFFQQVPVDALVLLSGPLGSGKTEFVKQFAKLNQSPAISSPSFAFHHHYSGQIQFEHWDLYRVKDEDELESLGFWDSLQNSRQLVFIEWPERLKESQLPLNRPLFKIILSRF